VSSLVLDTTSGLPAKGIKVEMHRKKQDNEEESWCKVAEKVTNDDGKASGFTDDEDFEVGVYRMIFHTEEYFTKDNVETFYPHVEIVFYVKDPKAHFHIPLLLTPFGFTTYRGS